MTAKKAKIINYVNATITVIALILECMPKSVRFWNMLGDGETIVYSHWSYFGSPLDPIFFIAWVVIICTITTLLLNTLSLFKDKRGICVTSLVLQSIATAMDVLLLSTVYSAFVFIICATQVITLNLKLIISYDNCSQKLSSKIFLAVFSFITLAGSIVILYMAKAFGFLNVIIAVMAVILFLIQFIRHCIVLKGDNRAANKRIATINWINLIIMIVALLLETLPNGIKDAHIEIWFGEETIISYDTSYFSGTGNWSIIFTILIVSSTILVLLFDIITMIVDKKSICITSLVFGVLATGCNIALIVWYGRFVTAHMIFIMIFLIIQIVTLIIKLKTDAWNKKIVNLER